MPTKVFISYNRLDQALVSGIATQLKLPSSAVDVFTDVVGIQAGVPFNPVLTKAIQDADWFILVYTGGTKSYEYAMFEAGQFFNSHEMVEGPGEEAVGAEKNQPRAKSTTAKKPGRFCCLYDTDDIPAVFRPYQSYPVFTYHSHRGKDLINMYSISSEPEFYDKIPIQSFLKDFFNFPRKDPARPTYASGDDKDLRVQIARRICELFENNMNDKIIHEDVLQNRLDIRVMPEATESERIDFSKVMLLGQRETVQLFGLVPAKELVWTDLRRVFEGGLAKAVPWMDEIEDAVNNIVKRRRMPDPADSTFKIPGGNRVFRPVLARYQQYQKGMFDFYVSLYETQLKELASDDRQGVLIAGIVLASRFRRYFIENNDIFEKRVSGDAMIGHLKMVRRQIDLAENESFDLGLTNPAILKNALIPKHVEQVETFFTNWDAIRADLFNLIDQRVSGVIEDDEAVKLRYREIVDRLAPMNEEFRDAVAESYLARIRENGTTARKIGGGSSNQLAVYQNRRRRTKAAGLET